MRSNGMDTGSIAQVLRELRKCMINAVTGQWGSRLDLLFHHVPRVLILSQSDKL